MVEAKAVVRRRSPSAADDSRNLYAANIMNWRGNHPSQSSDMLPRRSGLLGLEKRRRQVMALQQFVELSAVALREARGLGDISAGGLQQAH